VHGFIFAEIRDFVTSGLGAATWRSLLKKAELGDREYETFLEYPDKVQLVRSRGKPGKPVKCDKTWASGTSHETQD
jgi:hypothetical protein